jgi:hypothetical protein
MRVGWGAWPQADARYAPGDMMDWLAQVQGRTRHSAARRPPAPNGGRAPAALSPWRGAQYAARGMQYGLHGPPPDSLLRFPGRKRVGGSRGTVGVE